MSRFIELHFDNNNKPTLVNITQIICMAANGTGTKMLLQGEYELTVAESYQQIKKTLKSII